MWSSALRASAPDGSSVSERDAYAAAGEQAFSTLRIRYGLAGLLDGGTFRSVGTKKEKSVLYCISPDAYENARDEIVRRRVEVTEALGGRFADLDRLVDRGALEEASREITSLEIDVVTEALESAPYTSVVDERTRPFYVWLLEWGDVVPASRELGSFLNARAAELIQDGHLDEAERYLVKAMEVDRSDEEARRLRQQIQDRRIDLASLLEQAEELAEAGRIRAAEETLEEAENLGTIDPELLDETSKNVEGLRAEYLSLNPPARAQVFLAFRTLGIDTGGVEARVGENTGLAVDGGSPLCIGLGGSFRVGRHLVTEVTGSLGTSEEGNFSTDQGAIELYSFYQFTAGAGYRTRRTRKREISYQALGGLAWESGAVNALFADTMKRSSSQTGLFVKLAAEWKHVAVFVRAGFNFDERPDTLVAWSDGVQFGVAGVF